MGSNKSVLLPPEETRTICDETGFTSKQVQRLYVRFRELVQGDSPAEFITGEDLLSVNKVALNPLGKRLVDVMVQDHGHDNKLNFRQFVNIFAQFRRGRSATDSDTKTNKLLFLFSMYDRNHDSKIDRDELVEILKLMVGGNIHDDQISTIADHAIGELDADGDSTITFEEFCNTLSNIDIDEKMSMKLSK